ncbi:non-heme iron oxygenase ferredoxin subunit [uncultured Enterovirga sp.]|uniref:non-heme iron oxygenase ferredoxin subunit n=1 Tax=uncultured Enterovirga sp. TaxID=2026352 RepID=UPI0035CA1F4C
MTWHHVLDAGDLRENEVVGRDCAGRSIAIYRLDSAYHATGNRCTHGNALLSEGEVVEGYIECPLHFGLFEIRTGRAAGAPVSRDLAVYPVRVVGTRVEVEIPD